MTEQTFDKVWLKKSRNQFDTLYTAIRNMVYYRELQRLTSDDEVVSVFFENARVALLGSIIINWNKLFALDLNEEGWKRITAESGEFRNRVYQATGFNYQQWRDYRKSVREFSARLQAHFDSSHHLEQQLSLDPAFQVLEVCHVWLHEVYQPHPELACEDLLQKDYIEKLSADLDEKVLRWPLVNAIDPT